MRKRSIITSAVTAFVAALAVIGAVLLGTASANAASSNQQAWLTFYGWYDNTPPGAGISYPQIHKTAGGVGTYADPITFATYTGEVPPGGRIWVPRLGKYFIMEDDCGECDADWKGHGPDGGPGLWHFDLWSDGQNGNEFDSIDCEDALTNTNADGTPALEPVVVDPPSTEPYNPEPIFDPSTGRCFGGAQPTITVGQYKNTSTNTCLDDPNNSSTKGTALLAEPCSSAPEQQFTFNGAFFIINNLCADAPSKKNIVLDPCSGGPTEQWSINPNGTISDIQTGRECFSVSGTAVVAGSCAGAAAKWTFSGTTVTPTPSPTTTPTPSPTTTPTPSPTVTPSSGGSQSYEAESATLAGSAKAAACTPCSGGKDVTRIGGSSHGTVTFSNVTESSAGTYTLTINYLSTSKARPAVVTINGTAQAVTFPTTASNTVGTVTVTVHLNSGANSIEISGSGSKHAPDIDRIVV